MSPATVIVVGALPPPMHGAARVTECIRDLLTGTASVVSVDTAVRPSQGTTYHLRRVLRHVRAGTELVRFSKRAPRTAYFSCPGGVAIWYVVPLVLLARVLGYHVVIHHHSFAYLHEPRTSVRGLVRAGGHRAVHVCLCQAMDARLRRLYAVGPRVVVCSNAGVLDWGQEPEPRDEGPDGLAVLGHLGNLMVEKGLPEVLALVQRGRREGLPLAMRIAGPSVSPAVDAMIEDGRRTLREHFSWDGAVDEERRRGFLASIDVFVLPTRYTHEAEPLVVLEALAAGVPVVAYGRGCIKQLVGGAGLVVDPVDDFVEATLPYLRRYCEDPMFRRAQRAEARAVARAHRARAGPSVEALLTAMIAS